jgi:hypothetical protein
VDWICFVRTGPVARFCEGGNELLIPKIFFYKLNDFGTHYFAVFLIALSISSLFIHFSSFCVRSSSYFLSSLFGITNGQYENTRAKPFPDVN